MKLNKNIKKYSLQSHECNIYWYVPSYTDLEYYYQIIFLCFEYIAFLLFIASVCSFALVLCLPKTETTKTMDSHDINTNDIFTNILISILYLHIVYIYTSFGSPLYWRTLDVLYKQKILQFFFH